MARERRHRARPRRRRGRLSGLYKLISLFLAAGAVLLACVVFFRVNTVEVTGNARYTAQEIIEASGIRTGDNLIALPKETIANRILPALPYVRSVSIRRALPDGVFITVSEHLAAAAVSDGREWWYISAGGKLLESSKAEGPLRLTGVTALEPRAGENLAVSDEQQARLGYALELLAVLEKRGELGLCSALDCSEVGVLWLSYLDFRIKMPTTGDFSYIMHTLDTIFDEDSRVGREDSGTFDFTISEGKAYYSPRD